MWNLEPLRWTACSGAVGRSRVRSCKSTRRPSHFLYGSVRKGAESEFSERGTEKKIIVMCRPREPETVSNHGLIQPAASVLAAPTNDWLTDLRAPEIQHRIITDLLDGRLHVAPLTMPRRVLDVGAGPGSWALVCAPLFSPSPDLEMLTVSAGLW